MAPHPDRRARSTSRARAGRDRDPGATHACSDAGARQLLHQRGGERRVAVGRVHRRDAKRLRSGSARAPPRRSRRRVPDRRVRCRCPSSHDALPRGDRVGEQERGREAVREPRVAAAPSATVGSGGDADRAVERARQVDGKLARRCHEQPRSPPTFASLTVAHRRPRRATRGVRRRRRRSRRRASGVCDAHAKRRHLVEARPRAAPRARAAPSPPAARAASSTDQSPLASTRIRASRRQRVAHGLTCSTSPSTPAFSLKVSKPRSAHCARARRHVAPGSPATSVALQTHRPCLLGAEQLPRRRAAALPSRSSVARSIASSACAHDAGGGARIVSVAPVPPPARPPARTGRRSSSPGSAPAPAPPRRAQRHRLPEARRAVRAQPHEQHLAALEAPARGHVGLPERERVRARARGARFASARQEQARRQQHREDAPAACRCAPARRSARARRCAWRRCAATAARQRRGQPAAAPATARPRRSPRPASTRTPATASRRRARSRARRPSRTASVRLPARRSVSMSRMLFTIRIAAASSPTGTAEDERQRASAPPSARSRSRRRRPARRT